MLSTVAIDAFPSSVRFAAYRGETDKLELGKRWQRNATPGQSSLSKIRFPKLALGRLGQSNVSLPPVSASGRALSNDVVAIQIHITAVPG